MGSPGRASHFFDRAIVAPNPSQTLLRLYRHALAQTNDIRSICARVLVLNPLPLGVCVRRTQHRLTGGTPVNLVFPATAGKPRSSADTKRCSALRKRCYGHRRKRCCRRSAANDVRHRRTERNAALPLPAGQTSCFLPLSPLAFFSFLCYAVIISTSQKESRYEPCCGSAERT